MKPLIIVPHDIDLAFIKRRFIFFAFSATLVLTSVVLTFTKGLNFGIDFRGGIVVEVRAPEAADVAGMRTALAKLDLGDVELQNFGDAREVLIRVERQKGGDEAQKLAVDAIKKALGDKIEYRRTEFVGPKVSGELLDDGIKAVSFAMIAIMIYVWFRFEWQFGVAAIVALLHDVLSTLGIFSLMGFEFNLSTVAAVLTIAGYSINDTVVVFDRVRENLRKYKTLPLPELFNNSINDTLSRTLLTSGTTLLALLALYFLGGAVIKDFSFAMIWGIVVGTYSSICVAVPLLLYLNIEATARRVAEEGDAAPEGGD